MNRHGIYRWCVICVIAIAWKQAAAQNQQPNQQQQQQQQQLRGVVLAPAPDKASFQMVDRTGAVVTVQIKNTVTYQLSRGQSNYDSVIKPGMDVRGQLGPDGSPTVIMGRGLRDQLNTAQLKFFLGATDDEWAILKPRIDRVKELQSQISGNNNGGNGNGNGNGNGQNGAPPPAPTPIPGLQQALLESAYDKGLSPEEVATSLSKLREARAQARSDLAGARKDLADVITPRQEALLVVMGVLE